MLALFTHIHLFWVIGLILAMIDLPDFGSPLRRIAASTEKLAGIESDEDDGAAPTHPPGTPEPELPVEESAPKPPSGAGARSMLELLFCAIFTILPDYLYRRYRQGKRFGREITFFSVWFELRWGIVSCLLLTVSLITMIFYFHPSTSSVTAFFRTIPILPEASGRVAEVHVPVGFSARVEKGELIFRLDSTRQEAAAETARRKIAQIDAEFVAARADLQRVEGQLQEARSSLQQAVDELETKRELGETERQRRLPARDRKAGSPGDRSRGQPPGRHGVEALR